MNEMAVAFDARKVQATHVTGLLRRLCFALSYRDLYPMADCEGSVAWIGSYLFAGHVCSRWGYRRLDDGTAFVVPDDWKRWHMGACGANYVQLSAEAAGIAVSLAVLDWSMRAPRSEPRKALGHFLGLLAYFAEHDEALAIHAVLLSWCTTVAPGFGPLRLSLAPLAVDVADIPAAAVAPGRPVSRGDADVGGSVQVE